MASFYLANRARRTGVCAELLRLNMVYVVSAVLKVRDEYSPSRYRKRRPGFIVVLGDES